MRSKMCSYVLFVFCGGIVFLFLRCSFCRCTFCGNWALGRRLEKVSYDCKITFSIFSNNNMHLQYNQNLAFALNATVSGGDGESLYDLTEDTDTSARLVKHPQFHSVVCLFPPFMTSF